MEASRGIFFGLEVSRADFAQRECEQDTHSKWMASLARVETL
jgi:hypothetical protein